MQTACFASPAGQLANPLETRRQSGDRPLAGKRIVVTRAPEQARELIDDLRAKGAEVFLLPLVAFAGPLDCGPLDRAIRALSDFDWLIFTSQNAVRFFARRCRALDCDPRCLCSSSSSRKPQVAVVAAGTKLGAEAEGFRVDVVASKPQGVALASDLSASIPGRQVLLPRSDIAPDDLPAALRDAGANVTEVIAYRTVSAQLGPEGLEIIRRMEQSEIDVVIFASPSAFHNFLDVAGRERVGKIASRVAIAAIGATTAKAVRDSSCRVAIEAAMPAPAGLTAAIEQYYENISEKVKQG